MFGYYLDLALRGWKRNPVLTALMIALVGVGVAATMTAFAALRAVSGDPVPGKSSRIFIPQIDNQGPTDLGADGEPPAFLSYIDATALLHSDAARHRTIAVSLQLAVMPNEVALAPFMERGTRPPPTFSRCSMCRFCMEAAGSQRAMAATRR